MPWGKAHNEGTNDGEDAANGHTPSSTENISLDTLVRTKQKNIAIVNLPHRVVR